ncbi:MAG: hypothetical protein HC886_22400 [Leptolyngbyaceae cyanobacterium SM1_1_3]|nr:hypothetical protein [Leptolyngbyaceae cyanobacterium SM1_1_3]NJM85681.1 hypothetical protein [Leptolyngbyaceae cyanobacterium RM2_2_21]NJN03886.1 hypothetical protein [Leptolyngbyaceae cyanobacterium RM1_1_2]NJO08990.1 hypothetical protein [Leptolyngbyaceae cyanobacterium SL_1_1]
MKLNYLAFLIFGVALTSVSTVVKAQSPDPETLTSIDCVGFSEPATSTDLAQAIAQVEVEQILLDLLVSESHPEAIALSQKQIDLEACLTQLQPEDEDTLVTAATTSAVEAKITELEQQYATDEITYTDDHPAQQFLLDGIEALRQRLATLQ